MDTITISIEQYEGAKKYLIPSTLGIGLIEGYNQIGLNKSLSKPQLRREVSYFLFFFRRLSINERRRREGWYGYASAH